MQAMALILHLEHVDSSVRDISRTAKVLPVTHAHSSLELSMIPAPNLETRIYKTGIWKDELRIGCSCLEGVVVAASIGWNHGQRTSWSVH